MKEVPLALASNAGEAPPVEVGQIYKPALLEAADSLKKQLSKSNLDSDRLRILLQISAILFAAEEYKSSSAFLLQAKLQCPSDKKLELANILRHCGTVNYATRHYGEAEINYRKALNLLSGDSDDFLVASIIGQLCACLERSKEKTPELIALLERELELRYKLKDRLEIAWTQIRLSDAYRLSGNQSRAELFFEKAMLSFKRQLEQEDTQSVDLVSTDLWNSLESGAKQVPARVWKAERTPVAILLCVHGLGLHSGYYDALGRVLQTRGITTVAMDVRGFGAWATVSGKEHVKIDDAMRDVAIVSKFLRRMNPGKPIFLLGESMGGAIVLRAVAKYPDLVEGAISSVPAAGRFNAMETAGKVAWHILIRGNSDFNVGADIVKKVTEKEQLRNQWESDRFARLKLPPSEIIAFDTFMKENVQAAAAVVKPVLITQGDKDKLVKPDSTIKLFRALATNDKNLVLLGDGEHLIFEAGQFSPVLIDSILGWISVHAGK
jgi:alpha-beta hydrolase superfamily lysophospholipase